jgi:hypothetical protein
VRHGILPTPALRDLLRRSGNSFDIDLQADKPKMGSDFWNIRMTLLRSTLALILAALLFAQPVIASAWAASKQADFVGSTLCLTSEKSSGDHQPIPGDGHCCILCDRVTIVLPDLDGQIIPISARLMEANLRYAYKPAATGPPSVEKQPQQSRAPPHLV